MLRVEGPHDNQILSIYGIPEAARLSILNSDGKVLAEAFQGRPSGSNSKFRLFTKNRVPNAHHSETPINDTMILLQVSVHHYPRGGVWEAPIWFDLV